MPIYRIRTIYWKYRRPPSTLRSEIATAPFLEAVAVELRRIHAGRKKENHDHGRRPPRWRQPEFAHGRAARAGGLRRLFALRKNGALQPGKNPGARSACQRLGRIWPFRLHQLRNHQVHDGKTFWRRRQKDSYVSALLHRWRRERLGGHGARSARICAEVLHRRGQLGHDGKQHARFFHSRSAQVRRFHPHAEARPANQPEIAHDDVGLLVALARIAASSNDSVFRSRDSERLPPHERLQQPPFQPDKWEERALLRETALQNQTTHQEFLPRTGR